MDRPEYLIEEHLEYLDGLRDSGVVNMLGGAPYLRDTYPSLSRNESRSIVVYWMRTFSERQKAKKGLET